MTQANHHLNLSAWQMQAIADMGFDAWYLTPLQRPVTPVDREHDSLIDNLVGTLNHQEQAPVAPPTMQPTAPAVAQTLPPSAQPATPQQSPPTAPAPAIADDSHAAPSATPQTHAPQHIGKSARRVLSPPTITLSGKSDLTPPPTQVNFPARPTLSDWAGVEKATAQLATQQAPCFIGVGARDADDLCIFPPPLRQRGERAEAQTTPTAFALTAQEQQLFDELLGSIGIDAAITYRTPLIKHPIAHQQSDETGETDDVATALSLLADELALVLPKRIWLFGKSACQHVLASSAPPSLLQQDKRQLHFQSNEQTQSAEVICLPPLDYLLALPSQKASVWQLLKTRNTN